MSEDLGFAIDDMKEIIDDFLVEADELVSTLDNSLVKLESSPTDLDLLNEIFRAAHTIKGTSSFLGFEQVTSLTHKMEDILNKLRKSELQVCPEIMDLLLESVDILKILLSNVKEQNGEELDLTDIINRLIQIQNVEAASSEDDNKTQAENQINPDENSAMSNDVASQVKITKNNKPVGKKTAKDIKSSDQTIRVDVDRLDSLMNLMGELVLSRNSLLQTVSQVAGDTDVAEKLGTSAAAVNYITTELQLAVMKMRMQPVGKVFSKFPRLVRDLSRESKKEIELIIDGETTELDKSVIEEIGDPLVHIIRNSCDHGIESPEERVAKGKPVKGTVKLSAGQEGSHILITVEDDGKGLDVNAIRDKAVERGLVSQSDVERLSNQEVFKFIFEAGLSTAKVVSDVSGRGVGMDVVRTNIEKINGIVELDSAVDKGTRLTIKLPLTLAIIQGLLVESDNDVYILPLASVHETVKTKLASVNYVNQKPVLRLRDEVIPIINLGMILHGNNEAFVMTEKPYIVVVGLADRKLGIMIDHFLGQEEVVIKSLGQYLGMTEGVAGATILGDGRIRLIIDLLGLFNIARNLN